MQKIKHLLFVLTTSMIQLCCSCSSDPQIKKDLPFDKSTQRLDASRKFRQEFPGPITDIALAEGSGHVLASSIPDPEAGGAHLLTLVDRKGKEIFRVPMKLPVKSLDLAADASWMVVQHHEGVLTALDGQGKVLWEKEGACRPVILDQPQEVLCYHDDDTRPTVAFEVFSRSGSSVSRHPTRTDVLALKVSKDQKWILLGMVGGKAVLFDSKYRQVQDFQTEGEILDVSVSDGDEPRIATLSLGKKKGQLLTVFDRSGAPRGSARPSFHVEQVEIFPSGRIVTAYGNSPKGQFVVTYSAHDLALNWQKQDSHYADYSLSVQVGTDRILLGFEDQNQSTRSSRLLALDMDGKLLADIPLQTAEGAYLYAYAASRDADLVVIGTDDKVLQLYELR